MIEVPQNSGISDREVQEMRNAIKKTQDQVNLIGAKQVGTALSENFGQLVDLMDGGCLPMINFDLRDNYKGRERILKVLIIDESK